MIKKQIIALGGGGFSEEPENPLLDKYFIEQTGKKKPSICFLPTASGDADGYIVKFYSAFSQYDCKLSHLSLFRPPKNVESFVLDQDAIYVGGGNTKNLLSIWRDWSLDKYLRKAWNKGILLGGISAGSICWFEEGLSDSIPGKMSVIKCLGFIKGSNCPHYSSESKRRPAYHRYIANGKLSPGIAADNSVALHFVGKKLFYIVSSRQGPAAYKVKRIGKKAQEEKITPTYLGE